jgi:bacterioferritin-associated ferredoxin
MRERNVGFARSARYNKAFPDRSRYAMNPEDTRPDDEVLCGCSGTSRGDIKRLFEQGMDLAAISQWSGALSGCGGCEWDIEQFLEELAGQQKQG